MAPGRNEGFSQFQELGNVVSPMRHYCLALGKQSCRAPSIFHSSVIPACFWPDGIDLEPI
jgi:hypothetical protein